MLNDRANKIFSKCQAVILDMDGVLVDSEPIHVKSYKVFFKNLNLSYTDEFLQSLVGHSVDNNIETINQRYLKDRPLNIADGVRSRNAIYLEMITKIPLKPVDGIETLIQFCRKKNIRLGLASSSVREQIDAILDNLTKNSLAKIDYRTIFEAIVSGEDVKHRKPAADIYQKALALLNINAEHCISIEDSYAGIMSAKASGLFCVALKNQFLNQEQMAIADYQVDSINDVVKLIRG